MKFLFVGGPMHRAYRNVSPGVSVIRMVDFPLMAYHRTYAHSGGSTDPDWWIKNLPEPASVVVFEWHERDWESPAVAWFRDVVGGTTVENNEPADDR